MQIVMKKRADLIPYEKNPRKNDGAVPAVAASIEEFGFKVPIVIDKDGVIVAGHTRLKAAEKLGMAEVPCIIADDLTPEQIKAFRLADNKTGELAEWVFNLLDDQLAELGSIDMSAFGFDATENWFEDRERNDTSREEGNEEYNEFLDKFEPKKTTDDCYTPDVVYDAVADWVAEEYGVKRENFVRPFYPGGDYQNEKYAEDAIVVDNPPFSILAEILRFYDERGIKYFLFAPTLTMFSSSSSSCALCCGVRILYENGASVNTSFLTNLEDNRLRSCPELYQRVRDAVDEYRKEMRTELPKYTYPYEVVLSTAVEYLSKYGEDFKVSREESVRIRQLDAQKEYDKAIYGNGYLISERAAAERAAAERAAAERAAAERAAAERAAAERAAAERAAAIVWALSDREKQIVESLGGEHVEDNDR